MTDVGQSMQKITRDDYNILNGEVNVDNDNQQNNSQNTNNSERDSINYNNNNHTSTNEVKGMCVRLPMRCNGGADDDAAAADDVITDEICSRLKSTTTSLDETGNANGIKLEDTINGIDLFPTHPSTWQQHPMNSQEHSHHRLQQQQEPEHHQQTSHNLHLHRFGLSNNNSKLLLQSSDDPLICRGANDDEHPLELKSLIAAVASGDRQQQHKELPNITVVPSSQAQRPQNGCSSLTKQQLKMKAGLMSAAQQQQQQKQPQLAQNVTHMHINSNNAINCSSKLRTPKTKVKKSGVLKLRFHHQALPPEYLSHYEATQAQFAVRNGTHQQQQQQQKPKSKECSSHHQYNQQYKPQPPKLAQTAKLPPPKSTHENVRSWLQKIAEIQRSAEQQQKKQRHILRTVQQPQPPLSTSSAQLCTVGHHSQDAYKNDQRTGPPPALIHMPSIEFIQGDGCSSKSSNKLLTSVIDCSPAPPPLLPAPSADTSNSSNKRIIQYADLPYMGEITLHSKPRRGRKPKKADICHLIYKNYGTIFPGTPQYALSTQNSTISSSLRIVNKQELEQEQVNRSLKVSVDEPLNLCLRDQRTTDLCSVSSFEDASDLPSIDSGSSACTPVPTTPIDYVTDTLLAANMRSSMPRLELQPKFSSTNETINTSESQLHPVSVYYQKLIESSSLLQPNGLILGMPIETIEKDNQIALKIPIPSGLLLLPKSEKITPAVISGSGSVDYPEPLSTPSSIKSENSTLSVNIHTPQQQQQQQLQVAPQKRKRSAIFIPPVPAESTSNPATEVSICKFKFTGGLKPMLQEKKMLSVDSDGNYRYYSGTAGDKNLRCEFFPRESLQQSGVLPGVNSANNITTEKISIDIPPPSAGLSNELLQLPESPTSTLLLPPPVVSPTSPHTPSIYPYTNTSQQTSSVSFKVATKNHLSACQSPEIRLDGREHKRKSRRSSQLEKFEKTFKENGFLIQTQQLESAEGATYCKFRQLKKFTRYLFRNWKDYLPDELQQAKAAAAAAAAAISNGNTAAPEDAVAFENLLASHGFVRHHHHHHIRSEVTQKREREQLEVKVPIGEKEWETAKV